MSETDGSHADAGVRSGYKEVQLGPKTVEIPEEWEVKQFDSLTTNSGTYGANASAQEFNPDEPRYIRITDISEQGFLKDDEKRSLPREECEQYLVEPGQLLFARTGATAGKTYLYHESDPVSCYAGYLIMFQPDESIASPEFLSYFTQSKLYDDWVAMITRHGAQQNINAGEYSSMQIPTPSLSEQRRIADILSTVDEQIQQTEAVIERTEELKRGLAQDVLLGGIGPQNHKKIEVGPKEMSIPEHWGTDTLDSICGKNGVFTDGDWVESADMVKNGEYQLIQLGNVGTGEFIGKCDKYVSQEFFEENNCTLVEKGDLLISRMAEPVLRTIKVPEFDKKSITAVDIVVAKVDTDNWCPDYVKYLLNYKSYSDIGEIFASGSTRSRISRKNMEKIVIPSPPLPEQREIAEVLSAVDECLQEEKQHRDELQSLKRGLMQDLLTGQVRV